MSLPSITLYPTTTVANAPFCQGQAFVKGEVPAGSQVVSSISDFQCTTKNVWPDGSLKFAILSGRANVTGTTPLALPLTIGTPTTGTAIALSSISTTAVVDCGAFGSATFSGTDWASPFVTWVSGPKMSSGIYRKQVGSDAHLVAWLEVRLWSGGEVEVLPWIENGYMFVAGPTNKSATYSFTLGGTQRFSAAIDLKHHQRTPLVSGTVLSYWLGTDPQAHAIPDVTYLQVSEMVPSYSAQMAAGAGHVSTQPTSYTPLQQGSFTYAGDYMPGGGYQEPIGLLPEHDVLFLVGHANDRLKLYKSVVWNGYSAGRYSIHFRDEETNCPTAFSKYPTMGLNGGDEYGIKDLGGCNGGYTPVPTGGNGPMWDTAHSPSTGYMAYLLTGRFYFKEEVQFAAVANHYSTTDWLRAGGVDGSNYPTYTGAAGICTTLVQTRQHAWKLRTLAQAACVTPDSVPSNETALRTSLLFSIEENCRYFNNMYVVQANNPQGLIYSPEVYNDIASDRRMVPIWQHDFGTGAWGMMQALDLPISTAAKANMASFFTWKAKSIVHRLGNIASGYRFEHAGVYEYAMSPSPTADSFTGAGPWYASDAAAFAATRVGSQAITLVDNQLYSIDAAPQRSMLANIHPAIAYAVRFAVPGADAAYARLTGASNYTSLMTAGFANDPVWSVKPSGQTSIVGGSLTTAGPSFRWDSALIIPNSFIWDTRRGLGAPLGELSTSGTSAVGIIQAIKESGDSPLSEVRVNYLSTPVGFLSDGNCGYTSPAGAVNYGAYLDGPLLGTATDTISSTPPDSTLPVMAGSITSSAITTSGFTLSWPAASDNVAVTGYEVSINGGTSYTDVGNVLTVPKTGLASSTAYPVRVRAYDAAGNKATPLSLTVNTSATADTTAPTMQGSLTISAITSGGFTVSWIAASDNVAVTGYELSTDNGSTYTNLGSVLSYPCTGKSASTLYNVKVRAYDAAGNRSTPLSTTATTSASSDTTAPVLTGSLTITNVTTGGFTVTWPTATDNVGVTGYEVSIDSGTPAYVPAGNVLSLTKAGLASATQFNVRVRAYDTAGNRSAALTTTVTTATAGVRATTVTVTFQDRGNTLRTNLTGMKWAWFDQVTPDNLSAPTAKGTLATTDGSGVAVLNITGTQLPPGATGWLVFSNSDGTATQSNLISFAGPCVAA